LRRKIKKIIGNEKILAVNFLGIETILINNHHRRVAARKSGAITRR
jgi:hypothetical protein